MNLSIGPEDPLSKDGLALIAGSEAALREVYTADECFTFEAHELAAPNITFFVARLGGEPLGCIALCAYKKYAEIKRLYVTPAARGTGAGRKLIDHLERAAIAGGQFLVRLESGPKLVAAVSLYEKLGYTICDPFGDYTDHPASLFMEKQL